MGLRIFCLRLSGLRKQTAAHHKAPMLITIMPTPFPTMLINASSQPKLLTRTVPFWFSAVIVSGCVTVASLTIGGIVPLIASLGAAT